MSKDSLINRIVEEHASGSILGWCPLEKQIDLAAIVVALRPEVVVEIGVFGGRSLIPMALACEAVKHGVVIGIDPWDKQASLEGYQGKNADYWECIDHDEIYRGFVDHCARLGISERVQIVRKCSDDAPVPKQIDVLHIDGQHTTQAVRDVNKFAARVRLGGLVICDDLNWQNSGHFEVAACAPALERLGFNQLYPCGTGAVFQRISLPAPAEKKATSSRSARGAALAASRGKKKKKGGRA